MFELDEDIECWFCQGDSEIFLDGETIWCPECGGTGILWWIAEDAEDVFSIQ